MTGIQFIITSVSESHCLVGFFDPTLPPPSLAESNNSMFFFEKQKQTFAHQQEVSSLGENYFLVVDYEDEVSSEDEQDSINEKLKSLIAESRILAKCDVIIKKNDENVIDLMHNSSKDADIVFLGLALPEKNSEEEFAENLNKLVVGFKSTILVRNAESTQGELIE